LTLEWGKDLVSFSPRLTTRNAATHITVRGPQTSLGRGKDPLVGEAQAGDERARMGDESLSEVVLRVFGEKRIVVDDHNIASAQEANDVARARLEAQALEFITGRGSCRGNPQLLSRTVIELKGLGQRFSGHYYVTSTTHTIDSGGYRTDFEVKRNAR
jgi:phage protein D